MIAETVETTEPPQAPFPWFGGKSRVADLVWERFGQLDNYVEPFFGSGAVLLGSPRIHRYETINDRDGYVSNFWRSISSEPETTAHHADWPVNENDLHARHIWLLNRRDDLVARLEGDPDFYDPKIAGYWVWGISSWIAGGWCAGNGSWQSVDGRMTKVEAEGVKRQRPHLGKHQGVHRQRPHLGDAGRGVHRKLPYFGEGQGVHRKHKPLFDWFDRLSARLRRVRVCCGDWSRVCGPSPTTKLGLTGVFLDPPYSHDTGRDAEIYNHEMPCSQAVGNWAREHGNDPLMRIALCGYAGEYDLPGWECVAWKARGGYGAAKGAAGKDNRHRERIWFSPHCLGASQRTLF